MKLAHVLGTMVTFVLLTLTYFLMITPMSRLPRLSRSGSVGAEVRFSGEELLGAGGKERAFTRHDRPY